MTVTLNTIHQPSPQHWRLAELINELWRQGVNEATRRSSTSVPDASGDRRFLSDELRRLWEDLVFHSDSSPTQKT